jgi:hypothetical protein
MGLFSNDFYDKVKNERIVGTLKGAFTYEKGGSAMLPGKVGGVFMGGAIMKRACDLIITEHFLVVMYDPVINVSPGIFGFSSTDNFNSNIGNSTVMTGSTQTIADLAPNPKSISQAVPMDKVELVSITYLSIGGGLVDLTPKTDVGMIHFRIGGKFLGMRENIIFTQSQFDDVVNLFKQTSLSGKMEVKKENASFFLENME